MWQGKDRTLGVVGKNPSSVLKAKGESQGHSLSLQLRNIGEDWGGIEGISEEIISGDSCKTLWINKNFRFARVFLYYLNSLNMYIIVSKHKNILSKNNFKKQG